ncbi:biotin carboxylase [uncultured Kocuria sp.]|uniref:biotin carboxylase n=1 Tax=uncultured Kocuria sp. TaxID=259305 RepID=UPI0025EB25C0|nr:biotin carboxylase [uncultured Kocuria sp.]
MTADRSETQGTSGQAASEVELQRAQVSQTMAATPAVDDAAEPELATPPVEPLPEDLPVEPEPGRPGSVDDSPETSAGGYGVAADAKYVPFDVVGPTRRVLRNMSEVRHFFRVNDVPVFFVGATPFNLLGLDRWVRNLSYVSYYDGWDGAHPRIFTPKDKPAREFESGEDINNWLLRHHEVRAHIESRTPHGTRPKIALVFFNEETEEICEELGYDLILPKAELREMLDSKLVTTRLGNEVGVPSVPNILTTVDSWEDLRRQSEDNGLGTDLVVQTAYGDSGKTTFFIASEEDWKKHADEIVGHEVKVMKRINNVPVAVEAVQTSAGTIVGPFMTELTGYEELTPYRGGWCGNETFPDVLDDETRAVAAGMVRRLGDRLGQEGYKGFFEVDVLVDTDTKDVYLGELNPRISGATAITQVTAGAYADIPLFLFHLLQYMDVEVQLDVDEINERWAELAAVDVWSQAVVKETGPGVARIDKAPRTGQYFVNADGELVFRRAALDWHQLQNSSEVFFMRIYGPGEFRWKGADLGIIVSVGRLQRATRDGLGLSIRAKHLIESFRNMYAVTPLVRPAGARGSAGLKA